MIALAPATRAAPAVITHPVAKEDVALIVADEVDSEQVMMALREGAGPLLESVRLFDVYRGPQIPEGSRSLAFALRFRAGDRTLEASETAQARQAAVARAEQVCGAVLRGA
jgi:phenylalanyl-tRNA synthetase beta chain